MSVDPQVAQLRKISEPQSLHDVLTREYRFDNKSAANLFTVRLLLCGRKKGDSALGPVLEGVADASARKADKANPFAPKNGTGTLANSILIDYGSEFMQLVEGPERHVYEYIRGLTLLRDTLYDVHILFFEDDVVGFLPGGWLSIDKVPPACVGGTASDKTDDEVADSVVHDMGNLRELGISAGETDKNRRSLFADNAKINYPKLFPKSCNIDTYIECELFLTLDEFEGNFCRLPNECRECEVSHPMEEPLKY